MPSSSTFKVENTTTNKEDKKISHAFHYFDENGDGKISSKELHNRMKNTHGDDLSFDELEKFMQSIDKDGDGLIGYKEFVALVEDRSEDDRRTSVREAFEVYRAKDEGHITVDSLREALRRLGEFWSLEECKRMICSFDGNGDGVISLGEFEGMMVA